MPSALHILSAMIFWGQIQNYMMRLNVGILIVAMVKEEFLVGGGDTAAANISDACPSRVDTSSEQAPSSNVGQFEWDQLTRGFVLSAFSYGYLTTQILGGRLAELYGIKRVYGLCLLACGALTALTPPLAKLGGVYAFFAVRVLQGVCEGVTFPSLHAVTARWVPPNQRNSFIARSYFGSTFGKTRLIITYPLCGQLVHYFGWESAYYVIGVLTFIWWLCFHRLVYDTPEKHPRIDQQEKEAILGALGDSVDNSNRIPVPWKKILTSLPLLGLLITDCANVFGLACLGNFGPTYIKVMLGMDIRAAGFLSGLPMLSRYIGGITAAAVADWSLGKNVSMTTVRRVANSVSQCVPAAAMVLLTFSGCEVTFAMALLCLGFFFNGAISSGHMASHVDLSPNFAGLLFGITNTFSGGGMGFLTPTVVAAMTQDMTFAAWHSVFLLAAAIYFVGNLAYVFLISGEVQDWNFPQDSRRERPLESPRQMEHRELVAAGKDQQDA